LRYTIKKNVLGIEQVHFDCPGCSSSLRCRLAEAGEPDACPECGAHFTTPGVAEREARERDKESRTRGRAEVEQHENEPPLAPPVEFPHPAAVASPEPVSEAEVDPLATMARSALILRPVRTIAWGILLAQGVLALIAIALWLIYLALVALAGLSQANGIVLLLWLCVAAGVFVAIVSIARAAGGKAGRRP